jgi:hypothetical protein
MGNAQVDSTKQTILIMDRRDVPNTSIQNSATWRGRTSSLARSPARRQPYLIFVPPWSALDLSDQGLQDDFYNRARLPEESL